MTIARRLRIAAWIPALGAVVVGLTLFWSLEENSRREAERTLVNRIENRANELNEMVHSYVMRPGEQPQIRFRIVRNELDSILLTAGFLAGRQAASREVLSMHVDAIAGLFDELVTTAGKLGRPGDEPLLHEAQARLSELVTDRSREIQIEAERLRAGVASTSAASQRRSAVLVIVLLLAMTVAITPALLLLMRSVTRSLSQMREGVEVVGSGNLQHRIGSSARDEIGELARAFDGMTDRLQRTIVSRDALASEVEQRRQAEERLRAILEATKESIWLFNPEGEILDANATATSRFGLLPVDMVGKHFQDVLPAELSQSRTARLKEVVDSGRPVEFEDERAGMVFRHSFYPVVGSTGSVTAVVSYSRDITEARRAEQALRESESKFRIVADNTYDFEFWLGPNGRFIYVSPSCERITGHKPAEFLADVELLMRITHPKDRQLLVDHQSAAARRQPGGLDFRVVHRDGSVRWMGHVCQPIVGPDGEFLGTRGSNRDITARKQAEEESAHQLAELQRWQAVMLDREERNMELKREVNELLLRLGESIRYPSQAAEDAETRGGGDTGNE
jgi:PAS domain S-box-containing protein